jgi:aspartate/methionine/tyrosine aminotransferase
MLTRVYCRTIIPTARQVSLPRSSQAPRWARPKSCQHWGYLVLAPLFLVGKMLKNNRCTEQATQHGFIDQPHQWANLGQGAPEVDDEIEGSFPRPTSIPISVNAREYGPTAGIKPLREAIAKLYNDNYRQGKESQYTWENVCIVPGGRAGLIRIAAVLGNAYVGFFIPDYTAYNEMLGLFKNVSLPPSPTL